MDHRVPPLATSRTAIDASPARPASSIDRFEIGSLAKGEAALPDHATLLWMLAMGGGGFALALVSAVKPRQIRFALRRAIARDTLALRASETQREHPAGIERVERASPLASAALVGLFMAAGTWLYRAHLLDLSHRYGPAIHLIGPLTAVAAYLFVRAPTVGEKVDPQKAHDESGKFALNLFFLGLFSLVLLVDFLTSR